MLKNIFLSFISVLLTIFCLNAQIENRSSRITGIIKDSADNSTLIGVSILLTKTDENGRKYGTVTDCNGNFNFSNVTAGKYILRVSFVSYKAMEVLVEADQAEKHLGTLKLSPLSFDLKEINIFGRQIRAQQKGDTTEFNGEAFKVNPDANAQDLIAKMPGITIENGQVKFQGEEIIQVIVDGKPFFGDDPNIALKNLPAEIIDKIQVFDRLSDQSQFSGFNDGNTTKTINIVTKPGYNFGIFGKSIAGYGPNNRYIVNGNLNSFNGNKRISFLGLSNNINQVNFSNDGLIGSGMRGKPTGKQIGSVGTSEGITSTNATGINYSDSIGKKIFITVSYFTNISNTKRLMSLERSYFTDRENSQFYYEDNLSNSKSFNNRANLRLEYVINPSSSLINTSKISFHDNTVKNLINGKNLLANAKLLSETQNNLESANFGYSISNNILFRRKFQTQGRSFSTNLNWNINDRQGENILQSHNKYYNASFDSSVILDQRTDFPNNTQILAVNLNYTEPLGKLSSFLINYSPSITNSSSSRETFHIDPDNKYNLKLDTILSNKFENYSFINKGGFSFRINYKEIIFSVALDYQHTILKGQQQFPKEFMVHKGFNNILPNANFSYRISPSSNLRLIYRTLTTLPSVTQLQNVVNNNNPLFLTAGNPNLDQAYTHSINAQYKITNLENARTFLVSFASNLVMGRISNITTLAHQDSILPNGVLLHRGSQLVRPINLNGTNSSHAFLTYGMPIDFIKSNLNINGGISFSQVPGIVNDVLNFSKNYNLSPGLTLSSNYSENLDFSITYNANYNIIENTIRPEINNNYFNHNSILRFNWIIWGGLVLNTDLNHSLYTGLKSGFNQSFMLWNLALGKKFLKNHRGELRLNAFDLLGQNNNIGRKISETYLEDTRTNALQQYFILTFTYNLRKFKVNADVDTGLDTGNSFE